MKRLRKFLGQHGQTAVEYLLVTAVSISLGVTFFKKAGDLLVDNPNSFIGAYLTRYKTLFNPGNGGRPYKRFKVQR